MGQIICPAFARACWAMNCHLCSFDHDLIKVVTLSTNHRRNTERGGERREDRGLVLLSIPCEQKGDRCCDVFVV